MHKIFSLLLLAFLLVIPVSEVRSQTVTNLSVPEYCQSISVKVHIPRGSGSGVVFHRKDSTGTNDVYYVWTVGHLFHHQADIIEILFLGMSQTNDPVIDEASISQVISIGGEAQDAGTNIMAHLIRYSESTNNDIALLKLDTPFYNTNSVVFDLSHRIPHIGETVYNVGSPHGIEGCFSQGVFSFVGRKVDGFIYDQTTCVIFPGSSGGGYFNTNGQCVGLADIMLDANMNLMVPIRRIQSWAKHEHLEWALDPTLPMPLDADLKKHQLHSDL